MNPEKKAYFTQLGLTAASYAIDGITTLTALQTHPGIAVEGNPWQFHLLIADRLHLC